MAKSTHGKKGRKPYQEMIPVPAPLSRPPSTDMAVSMDDLDRTSSLAMDAVASGLTVRMEQSTSIRTIRLLSTKANLLLSMESTHKSIRKLASDRQESSVDALSLARMQLERCFLALLFLDNPERWFSRYRKNAWKTFASKYFRDQRSLSKFAPYSDYFGPSGQGIKMLREFAHEMDVSEDEFQTLRAHVLNEKLDPNWKEWVIADMPVPAKLVQNLEDPGRQAIAKLLHPYYHNLSHFTHGGMVGVMVAAILRGDVSLVSESDSNQFWYSSVIEIMLPQSYVAMLLVATLFAEELIDDQEVVAKLRGAWQPFHSDGSPMGIALWDLYVGPLLDVEKSE